MTTHFPISHKISRIFVAGAAVLLLFYTLMFKLLIQHTENLNNEKHLTIVAPQYLAPLTENTKPLAIEIDPVFSVYSHYHLLPEEIKEQLPTINEGITHLALDNENEYAIFATTNQDGRMMYAVEQTTRIEWSDVDFALVELALFSSGLLLFFITAWFIVNMANRIASPFSDLTQQLRHETDEQLSPIVVKGEISTELQQTLQGINHFRARIKSALHREQSFTRYISHELRTPMTIIKGSLSLLKRQSDPQIMKQVQRISQALEDMETLTETFLLLARDADINQASCVIDGPFIANINNNIAQRAQANNVSVSVNVEQQLSLAAEPALVTSLFTNLLLNAINCSVDGHVELIVKQEQFTIIDDGVGLNKKARGYDGFGIGLNLVRDICDKYQWQFQLVNNSTQGCCATVMFHPTE